MITEDGTCVQIFIPFEDATPLGVARAVRESPNLQGADPAACAGERIWAEPTNNPQIFKLQNDPIHDRYKHNDFVICEGEHNGTPKVLRVATIKELFTIK